MASVWESDSNILNNLKNYVLQGHWDDNKEALLSYIEAVQSGIRGIVSTESGEPVPNAYVEVAGIDKNITTSYFGEYWRLLSEGNYW